jgi:hypothetical protein
MLMDPEGFLRNFGFSMIFNDGAKIRTFDLKPTWLPPQRRLHYQALYWGIWDFLRESPTQEFKSNAQEYLVELGDGRYGGQLQRDRIVWTREWLKELEVQDQESDAETDIGVDLEAAA